MPKISAYDAATSVTDDDVFLGNDGSTTKTFPASVTRAYMGSIPPATDAIIWLSGTGSDSNSGFTEGLAKLTVAAAYAALPSTGGTIKFTSGRYDIGAGLNLSRGKPVHMTGFGKAVNYIRSGVSTPLAVSGPVIYSSGNPTAYFTSTGGTAGNFMDGCRFSGLVFEVTGAATDAVFNLDSVMMLEIDHCLFYGSAAVPVTAVAIKSFTTHAYGGNDCSWGRVHNNVVNGMALCVFGNETGTLQDNNNQVVSENICLGRGHLNTTARPCISVWGGMRCMLRDNNTEAYYRAIYMKSCYNCQESGDAGEFNDIFLDLEDTKGLLATPTGMTPYGPLGSYAPIITDALLVRGDAFTRDCVFILPTSDTANTRKMYPPTSDHGGDPSVSLGNVENIIISSRYTTISGSKVMAGTGSPNSALYGNPGDTYMNRSGGAGTTWYVKESGTDTNTGWVALTGNSTDATLLARANHTGTQLASTVSNFDTQVRTNRLDQMAAPTAAVAMNSQKITGLATPTVGTDAVTKSYADSIVSGVGPVTVVRKTADEIVTASTTLQNDDHLKVTLDGTGSDVYFCEFTLIVANGNSTMDMKLGFSVPTGTTMQWGLGHTASASFASFGPQATTSSPQAVNTEASTVSVGTNAGGGTMFIVLGAWVFEGGTSGDVNLQWAQNTSDAGNLTMKTNSFVRVTKLT